MGDWREVRAWPREEMILMFVIGGNQPQAEFTPDAMKRCGQWQSEKSARAR